MRTELPKPTAENDAKAVEAFASGASMFVGGERLANESFNAYIDLRVESGDLVKGEDADGWMTLQVAA